MKIILSAIVGNESPVIERFIRSFAPAVDEFVFVIATGNQEPDETREIIQRVSSDLGKHAKIRAYENAHDFDHVDNFGAARNASLSYAESQSLDGDYIIWADADDVLAPGAAEAIRAAAESGEKDAYIMPYNVRGDKQVVWRERMIKAGLGARWKHAIHEQLHFPRDVEYRMIKDATFLHLPLETKEGGHARNLAILQGELEDTPRTLFYLAQEYFQSGKVTEFKPVAQAALILGGLTNIEEYEILMQIAQTPGAESKKLAAEAYALMPDRREALALLINYAIIDGDPDRAMELAEAMMALGNPKRTYWSLNHEWYGWKGDELYRQCLRLNGKEESADNDWESSVDDDAKTVSVIHPVNGQPEQSLAIREAWLSLATHPSNVEYIFAINESDARSLSVLKGFKHTITDDPSPLGKVAIKINEETLPAQGWDEAIDAKQSKPERELAAV